MFIFPVLFSSSFLPFTSFLRPCLSFFVFYFSYHPLFFLFLFGVFFFFFFFSHSLPHLKIFLNFFSGLYQIFSHLSYLFIFFLLIQISFPFFPPCFQFFFFIRLTLPLFPSPLSTASLCCLVPSRISPFLPTSLSSFFASYLSSLIIKFLYSSLSSLSCFLSLPSSSPLTNTL